MDAKYGEKSFESCVTFFEEFSGAYWEIFGSLKNQKSSLRNPCVIFNTLCLLHCIYFVRLTFVCDSFFVLVLFFVFFLFSIVSMICVLFMCLRASMCFLCLCPVVQAL